MRTYTLIHCTKRTSRVISCVIRTPGWLIVNELLFYYWLLLFLLKLIIEKKKNGKQWQRCRAETIERKVVDTDGGGYLAHRRPHCTFHSCCWKMLRTRLERNRQWSHCWAYCLMSVYSRIIAWHYFIIFITNMVFLFYVYSN